MKSILDFACYVILPFVCVFLAGCSTTHQCQIGSENTADCGRSLQYSYDRALEGTTEIPEPSGVKAVEKTTPSPLHGSSIPPKQLIDVGKDLPKAIRGVEQIYKLKVYPRIQEDAELELFYSSVVVYYATKGYWAGAPKAVQNFRGMGSFVNFGGDNQPKFPSEFFSTTPFESEDQGDSSSTGSNSDGSNSNQNPTQIPTLDDIRRAQ